MYIQNIILHATLDEKTHEEVLTGEKLDISHLWIFGCPVSIHIPKERRTKMEPSGKKGTFVGYSETPKAFRIYVPGERHVEVSQDVTFHEEATFKWSKELECDPEIDEIEISTSENHENDPSPSEIQRENPIEPTELPVIDEPVELVN